MRPVEAAQLHQLIGKNILGHDCTGSFPIRSSKRKMILHNPLAEGLGNNRPSIHDPKTIRDLLPIGVLRSGRDPVNHRARKGNVLRDELPQLFIAERGKAGYRIANFDSILRQIITNQNRKRRLPCRTPQAKRFSQEAGNTLRICGIGEIRNDCWMCFIKAAGRTVQAISLFRDRQRHDTNLRPAEQLENFGLLLRRHHDIKDGPDDAQHIRVIVTA
ncbi:hypothetical protein D3C80_367370 [compost metagenome]